MRRLVPLSILLAGLAGTVAVSGEPVEGGRPQDANGPVAKPVGLAGCASSNCHGRSGGDGSDADKWRTSCSVWAARDPHARAFDVLDPEKNAIAKKMAKAFPDSNKNPKCLACHATRGVSPDDKPSLGEGVSCEACHGTAAEWLSRHTSRTREAWPGFVDLNDLGIRAKTCAGCHVGGRGRDMNHDMIAAGHPKLNFEFASHLARLPKHWHEWDRSTDPKADRAPGWLAEAWVAGAFAAGEAVCDLSGRRPDRELAEWNCYACHHDLMNKAWRPEAGFRLDARAWELPWPLGNAAAADALVPGLGRRVADGSSEVSRLAGAKRRDAVAKVSAALREAKPAAGAAARMFQAVEATTGPPDWETAYRMYLTLGVLELVRRETKKTESPAVAAALKDVEKALNLPCHPKEATYDPKAVREKLRKLTQELRAGWK